MFSFKPSRYQQAIFDFIKFGSGSAVVDAKAGSGKSTVIEQAYRNYIDPSKKTLILAFNKTIATELQNRLPRTAVVKTLNALGHGLWYQHVAPTKVTFESRKTDNFAKRLLGKDAKFEDFGFDSKAELYSFNRSCYESIVKLVDLAKMHGLFPDRMDGWLPDTEESWAHLIDRFQLDFVNIEADTPDYWKLKLAGDASAYKQAMERLDLLERNRTNLSIRIAKHILIASIQSTNVIDFNDQIYLPVYYNLTPNEKYDFVFVDESQDLSDTQRLLVKRFLKQDGRLIAVGDEKQCQPPDTQVLMTGGEIKRLDQIKSGDLVASYDQQSASFVGASTHGNKILQTSSREYSGNLLRIKTTNCETRATPNHKWTVRFVGDTNHNIVYLLRQGDRFRIGVCPLFTQQKILHFGQRCVIEKANQGWILGIFNIKREASLYESLLAAKYKIPLAAFEPTDSNLVYDREGLDFIVNSCLLLERIYRCLTDHGRELNYPFWDRKKDYPKEKTTVLTTESCNLMSDIMSVPVYRGREEVFWEPISVLTEPYSGPVISLDVETHHTYVADGIATHNSIYSWRGSNSESISILRREFNATVLPLSISYRCPKSVVREAQKIVPEIECSPTADEGKVHISEFLYFKDVRRGDAILCRRNAPLLSVAYTLLARGVPVQVLGRDIGRALVTLINKFPDCKTVKDLRKELGLYADTLLERYKEKGQEKKAAALEDKVKSISILIDHKPSGKVADLVFFIENMYTDVAAADLVTLSSIHRCKGLEYPRVIILESHRLGQAWQGAPSWVVQEELNIKYVAYTRAKQELFLLGAVGFIDDNLKPPVEKPATTLELVLDRSLVSWCNSRN